jgi:hypothetical protein
MERADHADYPGCILDAFPNRTRSRMGDAEVDGGSEIPIP